MMKVLCLFVFWGCSSLYAVRFSPEPVAVYYTIDSIKFRVDKRFDQYVGDRSRFSTCTGVAWFPNGLSLISTNLLDSSFQIYGFDPMKKELEAREYFKNPQTKLNWPENLAFSKGGDFLAVSNSSTGLIGIYGVHIKTLKFNPSPIVMLKTGVAGIHGVRFSPGDAYIACTSYDFPGLVRFFRIEKKKNRPTFTFCSVLENVFPDLAPKGIDFSSDHRHVAISYCKRACSVSAENSGKVAIFRFDEETGKVDPFPVSQIGVESGLSIPEDLIFYPEGRCLFVSNQGNDTITIHPFDSETGRIESGSIGLKSPEAQLGFPHGISISPDGKHLAVSNYGEDKVCIYSIELD